MTPVGAMLLCLGDAYGSTGNFERQRDLFERALKIAEDAFGPELRTP